MLAALAKSIFGSSNDRYVKSIDKVVRQIAAYEPALEAFSEDELREIDGSATEGNIDLWKVSATLASTDLPSAGPGASSPS